MNLFSHYDLARLFVFKRAPKAAAPRKSLKDFLYDLMEGLPGEARDVLASRRGGCFCHDLEEPCGAHSDPLTLDEADDLELLEEGEYEFYTAKRIAAEHVTGWFAHDGGACPVDPETFVDRRYPSQGVREIYDKPIRAKHVAWDRVSSYRVVSQ